MLSSQGFAFTDYIVFVQRCIIAGPDIRGNAVFNFLQLPNTLRLSALGTSNISQISNHAGLAFNNPALLPPEMHTQMNAVFNSLYKGIISYNLAF